MEMGNPPRVFLTLLKAYKEKEKAGIHTTRNPIQKKAREP